MNRAAWTPERIASIANRVRMSGDEEAAHLIELLTAAGVEAEAEAMTTPSETRAGKLRSWWLIDVSGYGSFGYYGTEGEAEEMREHKANWEGGTGRKERVCADHPEAVEALRFLRMQQARGYRLKAGFDERDIATLKDHEGQK